MNGTSAPARPARATHHPLTAFFTGAATALSAGLGIAAAG